MKNHLEKINNANWHDFSLENIQIAYDNIAISILSEREEQSIIICKNFIGLQYFGQWDECIIRDIKIVTSSTAIDINKKIVSKYNSIDTLGGGTRKFDSIWYDFCITLIDGVFINIVCLDIDMVIN